MIITICLTKDQGERKRVKKDIERKKEKEREPRRAIQVVRQKEGGEIERERVLCQFLALYTFVTTTLKLHEDICSSCLHSLQTTKPNYQAFRTLSLLVCAMFTYTLCTQYFMKLIKKLRIF